MQELLYDVVNIGLKAGNIVMSFYNNDKYYKTIKDDNTPVTQADIESNTLITKHLSRISNYKINSEESQLQYNIQKNLDYYWLIDPLDGTKDFIKKNGNFTINIALINKNNPILGVIYAPCLNIIYFALKNYGAYMVNNTTEMMSDIKNKQFVISNQKKLNGDRIINNKNIVACSSIFHNTNQTTQFISKYNMEVLKLGSSLKFCALAEGNADIYPRFNGSKEWDTAAGDIILREAGGTIIDVHTKKSIIYNKSDIKNNHFIAFSKNTIGGDIWRDVIYC